MASSIERISRTELGGVPTVYAPQPKGYPFLAQIVFRVGMSDEALPTRGITHLVEHLALPVTDTPPVEFNGVVMGSTTHFWFSGPRDATLQLLEQTCATLAHLPIRRLERERRLLLTEAETRSSGALGHALALRFGASGHGLLGFDELGLSAIRGDDVTRWATERFHLGTAALAFTGKPPSRLDLQLPPGERIDPPKPEPIRELATPSVFAYSQEGGVWATMVGERIYPMSTALWTLRQRLGRRLRGRRSLSYDVIIESDPLTAEHLHAFIYADCLPQNQNAVAATIVAAIDELAATGPTEVELEEYQAERERDDAVDGFLASALYWHASQAAFGKPFESSAAIRAGMRSVDPSGAADALRRAASTLLLGIAPGGSVPGGRFRAYPIDATHRVEGRRYKRRGLPLVTQKTNEQELIVGTDGVTLVGQDPFLEEEYVRTVLFDALAAAAFFEGGVVRLCNISGDEIIVDPAIWRRSGDLTDQIVQKVPKHLVVDLRGDESSFRDDDLAAGEAAFDAEDWLGAIPLLKAGLEREPEDERAWVLLGAAHVNVQNRTAAVAAARRALELAPDDLEPRRLLAHALLELGQVDEALEHTRKLLELDPGDLEALESAVFNLIGASFEPEALELANRAVELFPGSVESHFARGWAAQALGEFADARESLERALEILPFAMAHNNLGWVLLQMGEPTAALAQFERTIELDEHNIFAPPNRALALQLLGRQAESDRALQAWSEARLAKHEHTLELDALDADALRNRPHMLWNLTRDDEALSAARDAVERLPDNAILHRSLVDFELAAGNVKQADDAAERALTLEIETVASLEFAAWLGAVRNGVETRERAHQASLTALERRPGGNRALAAAGYGGIASRNYAEALASFDEVLRREPLRCCYYAGRALAHLASGDRARAEHDLDQADRLGNRRCRDTLIVKALRDEKAFA